MFQVAFNLPLMLLMSTNFVAYSSSRQAFLPSSSDGEVDVESVVDFMDGVTLTNLPDEVDPSAMLTSGSRIMLEDHVATNTGSGKLEFVDAVADGEPAEERASFVLVDRQDFGVGRENVDGDDMPTVETDSFRVMDAKSSNPANGNSPRMQITPGLILAGSVPRPVDQLAAFTGLGSEGDKNTIDPSVEPFPYTIVGGMLIPTAPAPKLDGVDFDAIASEISAIFSSVVETVASFVNATSELAAPAVAFKARAAAPFVEAIKDVGMRLLKSAETVASLGDGVGVDFRKPAGKERSGAEADANRNDDLSLVPVMDEEEDVDNVVDNMAAETANDVPQEAEGGLRQGRALFSAVEGGLRMGGTRARRLDKRSVPSPTPDLLSSSIRKLHDRGADSGLYTRNGEDLAGSGIASEARVRSPPVESIVERFTLPFLTVEPNVATTREENRPICDTELKSMTTTQCLRVEEYTLTKCDGAKGCGIVEAHVSTFIKLCATPSKELFCRMTVSSTRLNKASCKIYNFKFTRVLSSSRYCYYCSRQLESIDSQNVSTA